MGAVEILKPYLLSGETTRYLNLGAPACRPPYPPLSIGWLVLYTRRAEGHAGRSEVRAELAKIVHSVEGIKAEWLSAWRLKAGREFDQRLRQWGEYLGDYRRDPEDHARSYTHHVQQRAILALLVEEAGTVGGSSIQALSDLDGLLRRPLKPGSFLWDPAEQSAFPADRYWFLYGSLPEAS